MWNIKTIAEPELDRGVEMVALELKQELRPMVGLIGSVVAIMHRVGWIKMDYVSLTILVILLHQMLKMVICHRRLKTPEQQVNVELTA